MSKRALVIPSSGLGNFLLTIPLLHFISKNNMIVDVLLKKSNSVLTELPFARYYDNYIYDDGSFLKLLKKISGNKYDQVFYCYPGHRNKYLLLIAISGIKKRYGYKLSKYNGKVRLYFLNSNFIKDDSKCNEAVKNLKLINPEIDDGYIDKNRFNYYVKYVSPQKRLNRICIHAGAGTVGELGGLKRWPIEKWNILIKKLDEIDFVDEIFVLIGPDEEDIANEIILTHKVKLIRSSFPELVDILSESMLYVGNDNGVSHLAAFCGIPVYTLFGPSDKMKNYPLFNKNNVLSQELYCSPCHKLIGTTKCMNPEYKQCMKLISPENVFAKIMEKMEKEVG